eukprot:SAG31_NODE_35335_length_324_cov_0.848889_1_plen_61_part_01
MSAAIPSLHVSAADRRSARMLSDPEITFAQAALESAGVVAIRGAVDPAHAAIICERMRADM